MDVLSLQDKLVDNPDQITNVLIEAGLDEETIRQVPSQHLIKSPRPGGDNPAGLLLYTDSLRVVGTTRPELSGNLFTLVMHLRGCNFPSALHFIAKQIGYEETEETKIIKPFGGFYDKILKNDLDTDSNLQIHSEDELPSPNYLSERFLKDNISLLTQEEWGVRYSHEDDAILIPIHSFSGSLVGCKARANSDEDYNHRWWAYIGYPKTQIVYGLNHNYPKIIHKNTVIVFESEKSVLQCDGYDLHTATAIAGHNISRTQKRLLQGLMCDRIILAFDEGLDEDEVRAEAEKLKFENQLLSNKVGYIYDKEHDILKKGSKDSPSDNGKAVLAELLKKKVIWLGK